MTEPHSHPRYKWVDTDGNVDRFNAALDEYMMRGEEVPMRGIHDGPDCTTWPDTTPDPKRGRALLIVVVVLAIGCGVYAGVQDGPDGIDPLGKEATVYAAPVTIGEEHYYTHGEIQSGDMGQCSSSQQADCDRKCQAAAPPGYVSISSKCSKKILPVGGMPGGVLFYACDCTWVKSPLEAQR